MREDVSKFYDVNWDRMDGRVCTFWRRLPANMLDCEFPISNLVVWGFYRWIIDGVFGRVVDEDREQTAVAALRRQTFGTCVSQ